MEKLDSKVQDHLDLHVKPAKKALKYIEDTDWTNISDVAQREDEYDIQHLLTNKNIKSGIELYNLSKEEVSHPTVTSNMKLFLEFFHILEKRFEDMEKRYDWTTIFKGEEDEHGKKRKEIEFQTKVLSNLDGFKQALRKINFGDDSNGVNIPIYNDTPVPFMMASQVEEVFPEVIEYMEKRKKDGI